MKNGHGESKLVKDLVYTDLFATNKVRRSILIRYAALEELYGMSKGGIYMYNKHIYNVYNEKYKHNIDKFYALSIDIEKNGIKKSIIYSKLDDGWMVKNGNHRTAIALFFDIKEINAIKAKKNKKKDYRISWEELALIYDEQYIDLLWKIYIKLKKQLL